MLMIEKDNEELYNKIMEYVSVLVGLVWDLSAPMVDDKEEEQETKQEEKSKKSSSGNRASSSGGAGVMVREEEEEEEEEEVKVDSKTLPMLSKLQFISVYNWWHNSIKVESNDALYEMLMMLSTASVSLLNFANERMVFDKKQALQLILRSASLWKFCAENVAVQFKTNYGGMKFTQSNSVDMCNMVYCITRAQAQELAIRIALEKELTSLESIAKLSMFVHEKYKEAMKYVKSEEPKLKVHLLLKVSFYNILSHVYSAFDYNKNDENGKAMKLMEEASKLFENSKSIYKEYSKMLFTQFDKASLENEYKLVESEIKRFSEKYSRENSLVYHQSMPSEVPDLLPAKEVGAVKEFEIPEPHEIWKDAEAVYKKFELKDLDLKQLLSEQNTEITPHTQPVEDGNFAHDFEIVEHVQVPEKFLKNANQPKKKRKRND